MDNDDLNLRIYIQEEYTQAGSWFGWLFERLQLSPGQQLLELGSGPCTLWIKTAERIPPECAITLTDLSLGMAHEAHSALLGLPPGFFACAADCLSLPFPDRTFDMVLANGLLDLVPEPRQALDEVFRVLKHGGKFAAATGASGHLREMEDLARQAFPGVRFGRGSNQFTLENAPGQLRERFLDIQSQVYQGELVFTEPDPLVVYARSESSPEVVFSPQRLAVFYKLLEDRLEDAGEIRVAVKKGLVTGVKQG